MADPPSPCRRARGPTLQVRSAAHRHRHRSRGRPTVRDGDGRHPRRTRLRVLAPTVRRPAVADRNGGRQRTSASASTSRSTCSPAAARTPAGAVIPRRSPNVLLTVPIASALASLAREAGLRPPGNALRAARGGIPARASSLMKVESRRQGGGPPVACLAHRERPEIPVLRGSTWAGDLTCRPK